MSRRPLLAGLWLALGMLTALPAPVVRDVDMRTARRAMLLAPLAVLPLGVAVAVVLRTGTAISLPPLGTGLVAVAVLALGTRVLHLDGLADTVDGLAASYDTDRSLEVMRSGTAGPAGVVALVVALGVQVVGLAALATDGWRGALVAAAAVCCSRAAVWITAARPVPPARPDGLGATFTQTVPVAFTVLAWLALGTAAAALDPVAGPVTIGGCVLAVLALVRRATTRFGGVTGDVFGAAIEIALAALLLGAATL